MNAGFEKRLFLVWLVLSAISIAQLWLGSVNGQGAASANAAITVGALAIALTKVRIIVGEFMEARHAPPLLLRLVNAWLALTALALLGIYFVGMGLAG